MFCGNNERMDRNMWNIPLFLSSTHFYNSISIYFKWYMSYRHSVQNIFSKYNLCANGLLLMLSLVIKSCYICITLSAFSCAGSFQLAINVVFTTCKNPIIIHRETINMLELGIARMVRNDKKTPWRYTFTQMYLHWFSIHF